MVDRREESRALPHLEIRREPAAEPFRPPGGGGSPAALHPIGDRRQHSAGLARDLRRAREEAQGARADWAANLQSEGILLTVAGWPGGFDLALERLDLRRSGIELLSARKGPDSSEIATVFVPDEKVSHFFSRLEQFETQDTAKGEPRHAALIANIEQLRRAAIEELWTEETPFPPDGENVWWEVWLRRTGDELSVLAAVAAELGWELAHGPLVFPTRTVTAVRASPDSLRRALSTRLPIAELRRPRLAQSPAQLPLDTQQALTRDLVDRLDPADDDAPAVSLLDTGIYRHSLLRESISLEDVMHVVGADGNDYQGHGTLQAGLALYGDLTDALTSGSPVELRHRLESIKVLPDPPGENPPDTYGAVTARGTTAPEARRPDRDRVFCVRNVVDSSPVIDSVYFRAVRKKAFPALRISMGTPTVSVSSRQSRVDTQAIDQALGDSRVNLTRLRTAAYWWARSIEEADEWKRFGIQFMALEILTNKLAKAAQERIAPTLRAEADSGLVHVPVSFVSDRPTLAQKFALVALMLSPETAESDALEFEELAKQRNQLAHGSVVLGSPLPVAQADRLLRRFLPLGARFDSEVPPRKLP